LPDLPLPDAAALGLPALEGFYRWHARVYDLTRPFLLFGRTEAVRALDPPPGGLVLDVGCGTGFNLAALARPGSRVVGIECVPAMNKRARAVVDRLGGRGQVALDKRPYGTHRAYAESVDRILFSYSLSMMPPFGEILDQARADLRPGGRIAVVDFLDAWLPVARALERSHVFLGPARLRRLQELFPRHRLAVRSALAWRYFVFVGARE